MSNWILTVPKTTPWSEYKKELAAMSDGSQVMNYKCHQPPRDMKPGDRCYVVHDGRVRGWMAVVAVVRSESPWTCSTTGTVWPPGNYVQRSGPFHPVNGPDMAGFRGIRRYDP